MKSILKFYFKLYLTFFLLQLGNHSFSQNYGKTNIVDLALIYHGGEHRSSYEWTKDKFYPYLIHEDLKGNKNWLFDGFLFLEFKDGKGRNFAPGYDKLNARKSEWLWLIDRQFEQDKGLLALNEAIGEAIGKHGRPHFKHKFIMGLPSPIRNQKDWGDLDGHLLDFENINDRVKATRWYIDRFLERFNKEQLTYLELAGFYWVDEDVTDGKEILIPIGDYVRDRGLQYYWIPYWNAPGNFDWKSFKFDFAWLQPNHFFNNKVDDSRIDQACQKAVEFEMGMEMEFDDRALYRANENKRFRLERYIESFENNNVFKNSAIAYYQGGDSFFKLAKSQDIKDRELADRLAKEIVKRKKINLYKRLIKK